jgi:hypothetical protein
VQHSLRGVAIRPCPSCVYTFELNTHVQMMAQWLTKPCVILFTKIVLFQVKFATISPRLEIDTVFAKFIDSSTIGTCFFGCHIHTCPRTLSCSEYCLVTFFVGLNNNILCSGFGSSA